MKIQEIKDKNTREKHGFSLRRFVRSAHSCIWEDFLKNCSEKTFLQSWNWGEFQKRMGNKIWRFGIFNNDKELLFVVLVIKVIAKRGTFLLIQHGPTFRNHKSQITNHKQISNSKFQILNTLLNKLKEIGKEENCSFIRIASLLERREENKKLFQDLGFLEAPMHANAYEATLRLNLGFSEDELLKQMRKTTRYLITRASKMSEVGEKSFSSLSKQAQKNKEITIFQSQKLEDVEIFEKLQQEVVKKQNFVPFSLEYLKNEFEVFNKDNKIRKPSQARRSVEDETKSHRASLFFGKYQGKIIAGAFVIFWSKIGFYHYAALLPEFRKIPISYLLQWEVIKEAKKRGCLLYDFWGYVNPKKHSKHPWAGPTLFKMGFGGKPSEYVRTQDLPLSWKYWPIYIFEKLRKIKRGL